MDWLNRLKNEIAGTHFAEIKNSEAEEGKAFLFRYAVKLYSPVLGGFLWVVQDSNDWPNLKEKGDPVYDNQEIKELQGKGLNPGELKAVHEVKKAFKSSRVDNEHNN